MPKVKEERAIGGFKRIAMEIAAERTTIEIAKNMLNENISVKIIAKVTGLKKEEIEELKKEMQINQEKI